MSKKNEDSIERFFRKAVTQHDTAFRESDWLKMEKMLDEKAAERAALRSANLRRAAYSLIGLAIITASIVYVLISEGTTSLSTEEVLPEQMQAAAGEEAPRMDKAKEDPAAGLHSSPSGQINDDRAIAAGKEAAISTGHGQKDAALNKAPLPGKDISKRNTESQGELPAVDNKRGIHKQNSLKTEHDAVSAKPEAVRGASTFDPPVNADVNQKKTADDQRAVLQAPAVSTNRIAGNDQLRSNNDISFNHSSSEKIRTPQAGDEERKLTGTEQSTIQKTANAEATVIAGNNIPAKNTESSQPPSVNTTDATSDKANDKVELPSAHIPVPDKQRDQRQEGNTHQKETSALLAEQQSAQVLLQKQAGKDSTMLEEPVEEAQLSPEDIQPVPTRWSVALQLAPDFSSTALERYTAPGEAYGIAIGYQFHSRFAVSTGLIRSTKKYVGYGSDYQPPEGYWRHRTNGIIPDDITGKCAIVEIPLMVQYTLKQREKSRIYVAAGVSSYIMMSESYKYSFETPNPGAAKGWSTSKSSTYPFAIGHLSAAYERQLSHRWAIGLEPFLKIPFAGVGWSDVNLYSTGVFINLRYRFFRKQQFAVSETRKTTQQ